MICSTIKRLKDRFTGPVFPRLAAMAISTDHYTPEYLDAIAKMDVAVVNFYPGAPIEPAFVVSELKHRNPRIKVALYTNLNNQIDSPAWKVNLDKLTESGWWLLKDKQRIPNGDNTPTDVSYDCNLTNFTKLDAQGRRYPEWLAQWLYGLWFQHSGADWWYCDNVQITQRIDEADWQCTGTDQKVTPGLDSAYRIGHRAEWNQIRRLCNLPIMGNADNDLSSPEYRGQLNGAFLEGQMGYDWSLQTWAGWDAMMARYRAALANTRKPHTVIFNAAGEPTDLKLFRFAYTSCLLDDGYFSFSGANGNYGVVPWFDEYGVELGRAREKHLTPYENGVYRRRFQNGTVYCNPTKLTQTVDGHVIAPEDGVVCRGVH